MQNGIIYITDCDVGFTINGINYRFDHPDSVAIEDPRTTNTIRGIGSNSKIGLSFQEGTADPFTITFTFRSIGTQYFNLLKRTFDNRGKLDAWVIERSTGTKKTFKNCVIVSVPRQLNIGSDADTASITLALKTFDYEEDFKD
jgi:hypothetical protein